ncbi:MAG: hypothetical protein JNM63_01935 [Spirochaetia bacterium]|nr:hypothetical protein [Spirochaetia bacterium]
MKLIPTLFAFLSLGFLVSCSCIASSGCSGNGSQASVNAAVNYNALLSTTEKINLCTNYTLAQTFYGSNCTISWK